MTDIRGHVQAVLDHALHDTGVRVFWGRKTETDGEDPDEYVVYTLDGDPAEAHADDAPLVRAANVAVRYYHRETLLHTQAGREQMKSREDAIATALVAGGFSLPNGYFDAGDIDDIGFGVTLFECDYWRLV